MWDVKKIKEYVGGDFPSPCMVGVQARAQSTHSWCTLIRCPVVRRDTWGQVLACAHSVQLRGY